MHQLFFLVLLLLLLALHTSTVTATIATTTTTATTTSTTTTTNGNEDDGDSELVHLFPERARLALRLPSGASQRFRVHALVPSKVYDVKVSYPASSPAAFVLEVERVVAAGGAYAAGVTTSARTMPVRRLNTAKLRLHPHELLRRKTPRSGERVGDDAELQGEDHDDQRRQEQHDEHDEYDERDEHQDDQRVNVNAYRLALHNDQQKHEKQLEGGGGVVGGDLDGDFDQRLESVTVDIVLRADAEGVSTTEQLRECVFDIVVEEMLLGGAFPFDTVALLAWLALVLTAAARWGYPYLLRKVALELPEEREVYAGGTVSGSRGNSSHGGILSSSNSRKES